MKENCFKRTEFSMVNSKSAFKATLLIWTSLSMRLVTCNTHQGQLTDVNLVSNIINYVKPYIQSLKLGPETVYERSKLTPTPEMAIDEKIKGLRPFLQDDDRDKIEDHENTIEFFPRVNSSVANGTKDDDADSLQKKLKKYRKMRNKIKLALEREFVSNSTKQIVTKTLDELIATLLQSQCPLELLRTNDQNSLAEFRSNFFENMITFDNENHCYAYNMKLDDKLCQDLKEPYKHCSINNKPLSEDECRKLMKDCSFNGVKFGSGDCLNIVQNVTVSLSLLSQKLMQMFSPIINIAKEGKQFGFSSSIIKFVSNILRDSGNMSDRYKMKCTLVDADEKQAKNNLRQKDVCRDFRVCSEELREFLIVFYKSLNDTIARTFKNYAAMYERDIVTDESEEKTSVIATINYASNKNEDRISTTFIKAMFQIALDDNKDRAMNIAALREFVRDTVKSVYATIEHHLEKDLSALRARLLLAIKEDIAHNLKADMKHFEGDVVKQICSFFVTCKGDLSKTKGETHYEQPSYLARKKFQKLNGKRKGLSVKLQVALDSEFKDKLMHEHKALMQRLQAEDTTNNTVRKQDLQNSVRIGVTRTTLMTQEETDHTTNTNKRTELIESQENGNKIYIKK